MKDRPVTTVAECAARIDELATAGWTAPPAWPCAVRDGGNPMSGDEVAGALREAGFVDVRLPALPPAAPALVVARR